MSGVSAVYFLDQKGKPIIFRNYRGEVTHNVSEKYKMIKNSFQKKVLELEEANMKPTFTVDRVHYCWIKHQNIYIVAVAKRNPNLTIIFSFLHKLVSILKDYFNRLEEESIRDNFVVIYELLDEIMDHGYPQTTDTKVLKEFIKTESNKLFGVINKENTAKNNKITESMTGKTCWRQEGIKYKNNEVYLDVIEKVNSVINDKGVVLRSEIIGKLNMRCFLSGTPYLKLGLNDKIFFQLSGRQTKSRTVEMDDLKFHQCVELNKFESERIIEFVPPDGEFELMNYRLNTQLKALIWVEVIKEQVTKTKMEYLIKAKTNFRNKSVANNVDILIPVPNDMQNPQFKSQVGTVKYVPDQDHILWNIKQFQGQTELTVKASFSLPTVRIKITAVDTEKYLKRPVIVRFEIPYFTISGIQVRYLKITEKSEYKALPWVRYITQNGEYHIRMT